MKRKSVGWWRPKMGALEIRLLRRVLEGNFPNEGEYAARFEEKIERLTGAKHAVAVTSGTAGIFLALKALGVGSGDEVIVPDMTFIATANAAEMCGAKPVLADVDPATLNMSLESVREAVTDNTKAIIPVHVSGRAADMRGLCDLADELEIHVVEDAAEGFRSRHRGRFLGTFGACGVLSFSPNKVITTGQGGMVLTDDDDLHVRLRELKDQGRPARGTGGDDVHGSVGYNFKFTDLQAAVGIGQLRLLKGRLARMRSRERIYRRRLADLNGIRLFPADMRGGELPLWTDALVDDRAGLESHLSAHGMGCRRFWHPLHTQKPYRTADSAYPNSTALSPKALWLPSAFTNTDDDVKRVCDEIRGCLG